MSVDDPWDVPEEPKEEMESVADDPIETGPKPGFVQPRDLPALHTPYDGDITGYDVNFDTAPTQQPKPKRKRVAEDEPLPMRRDVEADRVIDREKEISRQRAAAVVPDKVEMDRLRRKMERIPKRPPLAGIGFFLFYPHVAVNWVSLSLGFGIVGLCIRGLIAFWPF